MTSLTIAFWVSLIISNNYFAHDKIDGGFIWLMVAVLIGLAIY